MGTLRALSGAIRWGLDRTVAVGYGVVYDAIVERFGPYRALQREVLGLVEASAAGAADRRDVRVLEVGCGPGNFSCVLAQAGFTVVGIDSYGSLIELARERRRAKRLAHLAFQHLDLAGHHPYPPETFDQVVSIHALYAHPAPRDVLRAAQRLLKPGGHAIIVNHTRKVALWPTVRAVARAEGSRAALRVLGLWLGPNTIFEAARRQVGPHYWNEEEFGRVLRETGFTVLEMRRTFFEEASLLAWVRKSAEP